MEETTLTPTISVIVPVYNGADHLKYCLEGIATSEYLSCECIVVNDGSTDGCQEIARQFPVQVLNLPKGPFGPAYARNRGAEIARGKILFFVDADVVLAPGALRLAAKVFDEQPDVAAVFGSYDAQPKAKGVVSQYRNLLHHFVHQHGNPEASTFWAGCGAIRRSRFEEIGGFDEKRFSRPSIEDIELGFRLRRSGHRILLDKRIQGTHLKRWNLYSLIRTDVSCRAIPWSRLLLQSKQIPNDLNLRWDQRVSFGLVVLALVFLAMAVLQIEFIGLALAAIAGMLFLNRALYGFFVQQRGLVFFLACLPLHILYFLYSGLGFLYVRIDLLLRSTTHSAPADLRERKFLG